MSDIRRRNSYSGTLPAGTLPTLPGRTGPVPLPSLPPKHPEPSTYTNERFLPSLGPGPAPGAPLRETSVGIAAAVAGTLASTNDTLQALKQKAYERSQQFKECRSKSVPKSAGSSRADSGRIRQGRLQLPLRRPERPDAEELNKHLATKLQPLEQVTNSILAAVEERKGGGGGGGGGAGPPLLKSTCKELVVGRASCAAASVVTLYADRLEYKFSHTTQGRIDMVMYTKDMVGAELDLRTGVFRFRVGKPLRHFIDSYDCTDPNHLLSLTFHEKADAAQFRELLSGPCKVALQVLGGEQ